MNSRRTKLLLVLFLMVGFACGALSSGRLMPRPVRAEVADQNASQVKWENFVLVGNSSAGDIQGRINNLGEDGWEVASVIFEQGAQRYVVFLKRHKH